MHPNRGSHFPGGRGGGYVGQKGCRGSQRASTPVLTPPNVINWGVEPPRNMIRGGPTPPGPGPGGGGDVPGPSLFSEQGPGGNPSALTKASRSLHGKLNPFPGGLATAGMRLLGCWCGPESIFFVAWDCADSVVLGGWLRRMGEWGVWLRGRGGGGGTLGRRLQGRWWRPTCRAEGSRPENVVGWKPVGHCLGKKTILCKRCAVC